MNTLVARHSIDSTRTRAAARRVAVRPSAPACASGSATAPATGAGWVERLADWADRQPVHRRVGSWVLFR